MSDFMFLFRAGEADRREAMGTPERAQRSLQTWLAWIRDLEAKGHLKEPGQPLNPDGKVVRGKKRMVTGCPMLEGGGSVEVRPIERPSPFRGTSEMS